MEWSPRSVCDLYRRRWDIEVFFKQVKPSLKLGSFLGHSANAVRWQGFALFILDANTRLALSPTYSLRKFSSNRLPSWVRIDSGWNWTPWTGYCLCMRPMISPSSVQAVISRQSGSVSRLTMSE